MNLVCTRFRYCWHKFGSDNWLANINGYCLLCRTHWQDIIKNDKIVIFINKIILLFIYLLSINITNHSLFSIPITSFLIFCFVPAIFHPPILLYLYLSYLKYYFYLINWLYCFISLTPTLSSLSYRDLINYNSKSINY